MRWQPVKSLWFNFHLIISLTLAPFFFSWSSVGIFILLFVTTICLGHSLGIHRLLIHRSFRCPKWLEYTLVYIGSWVGMAGPISMLVQHDVRDWAQRQPRCHDYFMHGANLIKDAWWQLNCDFRLAHAPRVVLEGRVGKDGFYTWLEKTWIWHQLMLAVILFAIGGLEWAVWGVSVRVTLSVGGHWLISYFAHTCGESHWQIKGAAAQGYNLRIAALLSMGESWHNNHHAYPDSALLGLLPGEHDPGWWVLRALEKLGLVTHLNRPNLDTVREDLIYQSITRQGGLTEARYKSSTS